jgi:hypothetical protein
MAKSGSFGICQACGSRKSKGAMVAHLKECLAGYSNAGARGGRKSLLLLRAQADGMPVFWLDLAARPEAKLKDIDRLLRGIWLECCGHISEFYGGAHRKVSMNTNVGEALRGTDARLSYTYDFGSSTELGISLAGTVEGKSKGAVRLVARNERPTWPCDECAETATAVCTQCLYDGKGFCCATHGASHDCGEELLLPVVNSPRMGVCGYTGEA